MVVLFAVTVRVAGVIVHVPETAETESTLVWVVG
jgi:hypothetical protein